MVQIGAHLYLLYTEQNRWKYCYSFVGLAELGNLANIQFAPLHCMPYIIHHAPCTMHHAPFANQRLQYAAFIAASQEAFGTMIDYNT